MAEDRKLDVLRAIVEDYVLTREPVGSKVLVERHNLGVSPATIRNDMAQLEEEGYIVPPHTSAGRVPTDKGYRLFVDRLAEVKPLSAPEKRAIGQFLEGAVDLDDVIDRAVRLLAQLTQQVAVVQYPSLRVSALRHVELVLVDERRLLVVIITDTGRVEQRTVPIPDGIDLAVVAELRARVNAATVGLRAQDVRARLAELPEQMRPEDRPLVQLVVDAVVETLDQEGEDRLVVAGAANLARTGADTAAMLSPVLEALEEQVVLMRLMTEMAEDQRDFAVRIGHETQYEPLAGVSIISSGYGGDTALARIGALGPTRMDYPATIASVRAVARYLSRILAG
jgi:heat-inducible transcriptional repressor